MGEEELSGASSALASEAIGLALSSVSREKAETLVDEQIRLIRL
jgi:hypothetical protein